MEWFETDTWIVVTGALVAMACSIPGVFLMLNRQSMLGDGISHSVLPGLAAAFLLTGSRDATTMLTGAVIAAMVTAFMTQLIHRFGQVEGGAALGVVFTSLFAVGLILIRMASDHVDLDADCVLYGALEASVLDYRAIPMVTMISAGVFVFNLVVLFVFYKELLVSSFDPALSDSLGISSNLMHYMLTIMTAVTAVVAFESVGSILVIAMLIVPGATAYLWTDRLPSMIAVAMGVAALSAGLGHVLAIVGPGLLFSRLPGLEGVGSTISAGMMAVAAGICLLFAFIFSPKHGLLGRWRNIRTKREEPANTF